jgi:NADPH:quinone reductase
MLPHLRSGALRPVVGPSFALEDAAEALNCLDQRAAIGKVLLKP